MYQLTPDMDITEESKTGPMNETVYCSFYADYDGCRHNATLKLIDNINKAILIDYYSHRLIVCGSFHGICSITNGKIPSFPVLDKFSIVASSESKKMNYIRPNNI